MKTKQNAMLLLTLLTLLLFGISFVHALDDIVIFLDDETPGDGCWEFSSAGAAGGGKVEVAKIGQNNCIPIDGNENANPGGKDSLKIVYELPTTQGASWFANVAALGWARHNVTDYTYLSFFVKGQVNGGKLTVRLEDDTPNATNAVAVDVNSQWREFRFPLNDFNWTPGAWHTNTAAPNRRQILQAAFTSQVGSGTVWIDDIRFVGPKVNFTLVPQSGNGPDSQAAEDIKGTVSNVDDVNQYKVVLYALGDKWYIQPNVGTRTDIQPDGTWSITGSHLGEKYAAMLIKPNFRPPDETVRFPAVGGDVLDITTATPTLVTPKLGTAGDLVTITMDPNGPNPDLTFGKQQGASTVTFNGVDAGPVEQWGETQIKVKVPQAATSGPVKVTVDGLSWIGTIEKRIFPNPSQLPKDITFTVETVEVTVDVESTADILPADGKSTATIKATVREKGTGNPITDADVMMQVTDGSGSIGSVTNNGDGTYTAIYTAPTTTGTETITVKLGEKIVTIIIRLENGNGIVVWPGDTNNDGTVNIGDIPPIARHWERRGPPRENASKKWEGQPAPAGWNPKDAAYADANGDGVIEIGDVVCIGINWGREHEGVPAAPPVASIFNQGINHQKYAAVYMAMLSALEADSVGKEAVELKMALHQLIRLAKVEPAPQKSLLGQNYPNPFNPETWIPYQLAEGADVIIQIYDVRGSLVRAISLGYKGTGVYLSKENAAYWDGRNSDGTRVASGVYFYKLEAGDFYAVKKMIVAK